MARPVRLRKAGNQLQVIPPLADILGPHLSFTKRTQTGANRKSVVYTPIVLYAVWEAEDGTKYLVAPAGLRSRIVNHLRQMGYECTFEDLRPVELEEPDFSDLDKPREGQDVILAKIATSDMGQFEAPTGAGKTWIICQVCKMYPHTRVIIVTPAIDDANMIRNRLEDHFPPSEIGQVGGGKKISDRRITVAVRNSLKGAHIHDCGILIYDEVHTAAGPVTNEVLGHATDCKMFGLTASAEMRTDKADLLVEAVFGPVIHRIEYEEAVEQKLVVPIRVEMQGVPSGPELNFKSSVATNRHGIWRNDARNEQIAADARRFSANGEQIIVSTDSVEHALELFTLLPDFVLVYGGMQKHLRERYEARGVINHGEHPINRKEREHLRQLFAEGKIRRVIATCWDQAVDFPQLSVFLRADGTAADVVSVQGPGRASRTFEGKTEGVIVDYMDQWNKTLRNRGCKRMTLYRKKGWDVITPQKRAARDAK